MHSKRCSGPSRAHDRAQGPRTAWRAAAWEGACGWHDSARVDPGRRRTPLDNCTYAYQGIDADIDAPRALTESDAISKEEEGWDARKRGAARRLRHDMSRRAEHC